MSPRHVPILLGFLLASAAHAATPSYGIPVAEPTAPATDTPAGEPVYDAELSAAMGKEVFLPGPPAGFAWERYANVRFLRPDGWHVHTIAEDHAKHSPGVAAASPEEFSLDNPFEHGFTVQILTRTSTAYGAAPKVAAALYLEPFLTKFREGVQKFDPMDTSTGARIILRYRDASDGQVPIIVHKFVVANEVEDTVYVFTYESSEATWEENWARYGTPMFKQLVMVPVAAAK